MLFGRQGSAFKNLILIRQLLVFSNLLLHQIYLMLMESVYLLLACDASVCAPWHITKASEEARSAEYVSTAAQKASGLMQSGTSEWAARGEGSSLVWPHEPTPLLPEVQQLGAATECSWKDAVPPSSAMCSSLFLGVTVCSVETRAHHTELVPLGNNLSKFTLLTIWRQFILLSTVQHSVIKPDSAAEHVP